MNSGSPTCCKFEMSFVITPCNKALASFPLIEISERQSDRSTALAMVCFLFGIRKNADFNISSKQIMSFSVLCLDEIK